VLWLLGAAGGVSVATHEALLSAVDFAAKAVLFHTSMQALEARKLTSAMRLHATIKEDLIMELQDSAKNKERFFAAVSHELRTPLNGIIGLSDSMLGAAAAAAAGGGVAAPDPARTLKVGQGIF
jgi:signal transduction histidine kinase